MFKRGVVIKNHLICTYSGVSGFEFLGTVHGSDLSVFLMLLLTVQSYYAKRCECG